MKKVVLANVEIRQALLSQRLYNYELADMLGISEFTLSRKLRKELPQEEKECILKLIESRKENN